jgi:hypothetical protein
LPDLRGVFLRGVDKGMDDRPSGRDPDRDRRDPATTANPANPGNSGNDVGSTQPRATALPMNLFSTDAQGNHVHRLDLEMTASRAARGNSEVNNTVANPFVGNVTKNTDPAGQHNHAVNAGGDAETRPINTYVYWIIRAR